MGHQYHEMTNHKAEGGQARSRAIKLGKDWQLEPNKSMLVMHQ